MRRALFILAALACLAFASNAGAQTYYVSTTGSDTASGTSPTSAWKSVAKVNSFAFVGGDRVLFEGGGTFAGLLMPPTSGAPGAAVTFSSYGTGRANLRDGTQLSSRSWITLDGLRVDTGAWQTAGSTRGVMSTETGTGSQNIAIRNCVFANVAIGLLISNFRDRDWTVSDNVIQYTRDSGMLVYDPTQPNEIGGTSMLFERNQILDTGLDATINWKKHGVYDVGTNSVWRNNVIQRFQEGGFSVRARGNTFEGNTIADGPYPFYFSPYDATAATTTIAYNRISNYTQDGIELNKTGLVTTSENFVVANNTIVGTAGAAGMRVIGTGGSVRLANNVVSVGTSGSYVLRVDAVPGGGLVEKNNSWFRAGGNASWAWLGTVFTSLSSYRSASGLGAADQAVDPQLDQALKPLAASPVIDAGTTSVEGSPAYTADCSAAAWHYCASAPDLGAVETAAAVAPPPPPPSPEPAPLQPASALSASGITSTGLKLTWIASPDTRVVGYQVSANGALLGKTSSTLLLVGALTCGTKYAFSVVAYDAGGATSLPATASVTTAPCPDTTPPSLTVWYPTQGQVVPLSFTVTTAASDASGVVAVIVWVDGAQVCYDTAAPYECGIGKLRRGSHTIRVRAVDTAGNITEQTVTVWADRNATRTLSALRRLG